MKKRFGKYHDFIVLWTMFWTAISVGLILGYLLNQLVMCMSGAHYILEEEELEEVKPKPSMVCNYSGLPSALSYANENKVRRTNS